jgi:preprotein translocase subunit SecD
MLSTCEATHKPYARAFAGGKATTILAAMVLAAARRAAAGASILVLGLLVAACGGSDMPASSTDARASGASALQLRLVEDVVPPNDPAWKTTDPTCPAHEWEACLAAAGTDHIAVRGIGDEIYLLGPVIVDGDDVAEATARQEDPPRASWSVYVTLSPEASDAFSSATASAVGSRIAMVVGGRVVSAPTVEAPIRSGNVVVTGELSEAEARALAERLGG